MISLPCVIDQEVNLCLIAKIPLDKIQEILKGKVEIVSLIFDAAENILELGRREGTISKLS